MNSIKLLYLKYYIHYFFSKSHIEKYDIFKAEKKCFVFLAADYGNLGDVAITRAQEKILKEEFPDHIVVNVPISRTLSDLKAIKNICSKNDIITLIGGGNMSDLYYDIELLRQLVIKCFPDNKIYSFPQTLFFTNTRQGKYMLRRTKRCYNKRKDNLTLIARESVSFNKMKELFSCHVILMPDVVMTLDKREPSLPRTGITFCFRNDKEKSISSDVDINLKVALSNQGYNIVNYDTHIDKERLSSSEQEEELNKILCQFKKSQWVFTDRLHGMIFCFITQTPCVVFPNVNYKVEKCYEWIKECGYIFLIKNDDIEELLSLLSATPKYDFDSVHSRIKMCFSQLCK